jgi:hypothetical protein
VMWLSFHWFFWPRMSGHLLLAFVTHNPISLLLGGYRRALRRPVRSDRVVGRSRCCSLGYGANGRVGDVAQDSRAAGGVMPDVFSSGGWKARAAALAWLRPRAARSRVAAWVCSDLIIHMRGADIPCTRSFAFRRAGDLKPWACVRTVANAGLVLAVRSARS